MIKILWLLLIAAWMGGCGYDPSCYDGCNNPKVVEHTTEVTKTVTVVGQPGPAGERGAVGPAGRDGIDGLPGTDAVLPSNTVIDIIPLCGGPEVVLVTEDGTLIGHYSDGKRQYTTVLVPGRYTTSDGHACNFSVDDENNLTWED